MALDTIVFAQKASAVERHLRRVEARLPASAATFAGEADASDAVVLHLWQAVQIVLDIATSLCVQLHLGPPTSYADAFVKLRDAKHLNGALAAQLISAVGFRNRVAHEYEAVDLARVYQAATVGPQNLRDFLVLARGLIP